MRGDQSLEQRPRKPVQEEEGGAERGTRKGREVSLYPHGGRISPKSREQQNLLPPRESRQKMPKVPVWSAVGSLETF